MVREPMELAIGDIYRDAWQVYRLLMRRSAARTALVRYGVTFVWNSLAAPFDAHVLTVLYYRVTDPARPVIHPDVLHWKSVWEPSG